MPKCAPHTPQRNLGTITAVSIYAIAKAKSPSGLRGQRTMRNTK